MAPRIVCFRDFLKIKYNDFKRPITVLDPSLLLQKNSYFSKKILYYISSIQFAISLELSWNSISLQQHNNLQNCPP